MNRIKFRPKPIWRETEHVKQGREILLALEPCAVLVRLKGTRTTYRVPVETLYTLGATLEARRIMAEKKQAKKERTKK